MDVHLDIPEDLAQQLASDANGLTRAALWRQHNLSVPSATLVIIP